MVHWSIYDEKLLLCCMLIAQSINLTDAQWRQVVEMMGRKYTVSACKGRFLKMKREVGDAPPRNDPHSLQTPNSTPSKAQFTKGKFTRGQAVDDEEVKDEEEEVDKIKQEARELYTPSPSEKVYRKLITLDDSDDDNSEYQLYSNPLPSPTRTPQSGRRSRQHSIPAFRVTKHTSKPPESRQRPEGFKLHRIKSEEDSNTSMRTSRTRRPIIKQDPDEKGVITLEDDSEYVPRYILPSRNNGGILTGLL